MGTCNRASPHFFISLLDLLEVIFISILRDFISNYVNLMLNQGYLHFLSNKYIKLSGIFM